MGKFIILKNTFIDIHPDTKIIKAEEYSKLVEAEKLLEEARREAENILETAKAAYEEEKRKGYEDGLREGQRKIAEKMLETVHKTVDYLASAEETMCSLVIGAIKKIIGDMDDKEVVTRVVKNALAMVRNQKQVVLKVAPEDLETVQSRLNEIMGNFPSIGFVEVVADSRLKKNSCVLESEMGIIDASVDVQLKAIENALQRTIKRAP